MKLCCEGMLLLVNFGLVSLLVNPITCLKKTQLISVCMHVHCMTAGTESTRTEVLYLAAWQVQPAAMKD